MDEQKLNRKLAEWAGFRYIEPKYCESCHRQAPPYWVKGGIGRRLDSNEILVFTQSLDACFKWLVPNFYWVRLEEIHPPFPISMPLSHLRHSDMDSGWRASVLEKPRCIARDYCADNPALALCLAIEKLIDAVHPKE